jgi:alkanesulfonate monooxygenase
MIKRLLEGGSPVTYDGEFYKVKNLKMTPALASDLSPGIFMSGSSEAGLAAARALGATAVMYPKPAEEYENARAQTMDSGIRVGIITREEDEQSWSIAHDRFPEDRKGQLTRQLANKVSDSVWHKQLSQLDKTTEHNPYWLVPFNNYKTMCPYLVGSYDRVAKELARYIAVGYKTFILDIPPNEEELHHTNVVFRRAQGLCAE